MAARAAGRGERVSPISSTPVLMPATPSHAAIERCSPISLPLNVATSKGAVPRMIG